MMLPPADRVYLACGFTDMRKGFDGLAALVQTVLNLDPYGGALFIFRGRRGDPGLSIIAEGPCWPLPFDTGVILAWNSFLTPVSIGA